MNSSASTSLVPLASASFNQLAIKSDSKKHQDITKHGRITAKSVVDDLSKQKGLRIISLKEDGDKLDDSIECIASEFANVQRGTIETLVSPMTLSLKKETHSRKINITSLEKVKNILGKLIKKEGKPFCRFEKVQVLYLPLFGRGDSDEERPILQISLMDLGRENAGKDPTIQSVAFEADEMALVELSMDYFVHRNDVKYITLDMTIDKLPIESRAYGSISIGFFVHEEFAPFRITPKNSTLLYIDSMKVPTDINKDTVFKSLSDKITKEVNTKRIELRKKNFSRMKQFNKSRKRIELIKESDHIDEDEEVEEESVDADAKIVPLMNKGKEVPMLKRTILSDKRKFKTMLDTGSDAHFIYVEEIIPTMKYKNFAGIDEMDVEI